MPSGRPRLFVVFLTMFLDLLGFGLIVPIAPYYADTFGASESQVALLGSCFSLMQLLFVPMWGSLSDRIGRRPVILFSVLGSAIAMALFGAASSLPMLFAARLAHGAMTANIATVQAYIADITSESDRAKGMGLIGAAFGLGFILGPFAGGELGSLGQKLGIGLGLVGYGASALAVINFLLALFLLPESRPKGMAPPPKTSRLDALRGLLSRPGLPSLIGAFFLSTFAFAAMEWTFALLTAERLGWTTAHQGPRRNGLVFAGVGVIATIVQGGLIGRLTTRFGEAALLRVGLFTIAIGLAVHAMMNGLAILAVGSTCLALGHSLSNPTVTALVSKRSPADLQGGTLGVMQSVGALARVLGPAVLGLVFERASSAIAYFAAAAIAAVAGILATIGVARPPRVEGPP